MRQRRYKEVVPLCVRKIIYTITVSDFVIQPSLSIKTIMDNIDFKGKYATKRKGTILSWDFDRNNVKHIILIQEHVFIKSIMGMFSYILS